MTCAVDGCDRTGHARGWCVRHYRNWLHYGHALAVRHWPVRDRLERIGWDVTTEGCWEWRGQRHEHGYGLLSGRRAHRLMFEAVNGQIPDGLVVRHRCDNPPCVNPEHLVLGTCADNSRDMAERLRARRDICVNGHDRTAPGAVKEIEHRGVTERLCIQCDRERKLRWYHQRKAAA